MKALASEMTANFSRRLLSLGITVREFTGDMSLTKAEITSTQILVTTPEKWDVATRKGTGDIALTSLVKLLIIDEVHLLHGDRGPVLEALVARTLRQVESSQNMIRIVGLSATLPNYKDVARFLRVNFQKGLFYFDGRFRPVPLIQTFIGVRGSKTVKMQQEMDSVCYDKVHEMVQKGHQVMVFVHARNATVKTANVFRELATQKNHLSDFLPEDSNRIGVAKKAFERCHSKELSELLNSGFSIHHAGLLRSDRNLVEKYFAEGAIKVLVCTATLAWGVNLPAHAVIIKGTELYDSKHGTFVDLGMLDVLQIFGRAGRPQFDTSGHGIIITPHAKLHKYLSLLTNQIPIESCFVQHLVNNLNAEVVLGTISNVEEAVLWLSYTYLFVRMRINPHVYGILLDEVELDPMLVNKRKEFIINAAMALDRAQMLRYNERTGDLASTDLGRTASHFYISHDSIEIFNQTMAPFMNLSEILTMIASAKEFEQLQVRDDEVVELESLSRKYCHVECKGSAVNINGKVNILLQTYLARGRAKGFSLISDLVYISQNATRIARALFDMVLRRNNAMLSSKLLEVSQMFEMRQWDFESELRQFSDVLPWEIIDKIEQRKLTFNQIREMDSKELGILLRNQNIGAAVKKCAMQLPYIEATESIQPITRTILRINLELYPEFEWNDKFHGKTSVAFWIWIEDPETDHIYHWEQFLISKRQVIKKEVQKLVFTIPLVEPLPSQYILHCTSDRWLGTTYTIPLTFQHLILPHSHASVTDLLELHPLPLSALKNQDYQNLYKFTHFNPIQTQIFHCLYHTDNNVLLGAPTGSGKTIAAEIAMFRVFNEQPEAKVVYIAPLKALVRERIIDWKVRLEEKLKKSVVELTGDVTPDIKAITNASVIVTTPEKWDGVSRSWQTRNYVRQVALVVLDEVHLLGEERGPVLEIIISRINFISTHSGQHTRIIALTTALSTAADLASWLHIGEMGLYNFRPSVRPVPLEVHISGYAGRNYCPRMATMNKPIYQAIRQHSPTQPVMIFVSSRRQTRLTALDLIAYLGGEDNPKQWVHKNDYEMDQIIENIRDPNLKLCLAFGLGLHHAGLQDNDRKIVEELFVNQYIQ
ncbi:activating signal cointegrator 1 complex subunit 3-like, partial [Daktulosphaira vitifoliae]|uniref:activating signal cointegrator 1 complex subunit 3-like n=1 Tax=Daktulosphaira vitifoliae TaxID=58002 RepID=UPI0021AA1897